LVYAQATDFNAAKDQDTIEGWLAYVRAHKTPEEQYLRAHSRLVELLMEHDAIEQSRAYLKEFDTAALDKRCEALDASICGETLPGMLALELDFMERRRRDAEAQAQLERLGPEASLSELLFFLHDNGPDKDFDFPDFYYTAHERVAKRLAQEGSFTQLVEYLSWYETSPEAHPSMCALLQSLTQSHAGKLATLRDAIRARQQARGSAFDVDVSPVQRFLTAAHSGTTDAWVRYLSHDDEGSGYDFVCALEAKKMLLGAAKKPLNAKQLITLYTATASEAPTSDELATLAQTAQRMNQKEARALAKAQGLPSWFKTHMACHDALAHEQRWELAALEALVDGPHERTLPQQTRACLAQLDQELEARRDRLRERERRRLEPTWARREQEHLKRCRAARDVVVRERAKLERMALRLGPYKLPDNASEPLRAAIKRYQERVAERSALLVEMVRLGDHARADRFNRHAQMSCAIPRSR
jgi:hypothetical protein